MEAVAGGTRTEYGQPDGDRHNGGRSGADQDGTTRHPHAAHTSWRLDACPQGRRRLDTVRGAPRERDPALLLGKPIGELRRRSDSCLDGGTTLRSKRPVRKRRQLGELVIAGLVFSTTSHRHGNAKGNPDRATASRRALLEAGARRFRRGREANTSGERRSLTR